MKELDHTFDDDGIFWIGYKDFLKFYPVIDRIRLIGPEWTVTQQWTSVNVPWTVDYLDTSFKITITKAGPVVLVLSQPDPRYFKGVQGRYRYALHFRLYKDGESTYLLRSMDQSGSMRSCNAELELEPGTFQLLVKVAAERVESKKTYEETIREYRDERREKLLAVGKSFDVTHSKGKLRETEEANASRTKKENDAKHRERMVDNREFRKKRRDREKLRRKRNRAEMNRKMDEKKAARKAEREAEMKEKEAEEKERKENEAEAQDVPGEQSEGTGLGNEPDVIKDKSDAAVEGVNVVKAQDESAPEPSSSSGAANPESQTQSSAESQAPETTEGSSFTTTGQLTPSSSPSSMSVAKNKLPTEETAIEPNPSPQEIKVFNPEPPKDSNHDPLAQPSTQPTAKDEPDMIDPSALPRAIDHPPPKHRQQSPPAFRSLPHFPPPPARERDHEVIIMDDTAPPYRSSFRPGRIAPPSPGSASASANGAGDHDGGDFFPRHGRGHAHSPVSSLCDDDFAWDSAMDGSALTESGDGDGYSSQDSDDMYALDAWQATCVVGLRVCSLDEGARIEVVRGEKSRAWRGEIGMGRARSPA